MTKEEIEQELMMYLGVSKIIWLPRGLYGILSKLCFIIYSVFLTFITLISDLQN